MEKLTIEPGKAMILPDGYEIISIHEWLPIETAPRDGTHVLLRIPGSFIDGVPSDLPVTIEGWFAEADRDGGPRWIPVTLDFHGCGCCGGSNPIPTHWMPLPEPPK